MLLDIAANGLRPYPREKAADRLEDRHEAQKIYAELLKKRYYIRGDDANRIINKITEQDILLDIAKAKDSYDNDIREKAADRLENREEAQKVYAELAKFYYSDSIIDKIINQDLLLDIAKSAKYEDIRRKVCLKIGGHHLGKNCICEICKCEEHDFSERQGNSCKCLHCGAVKHYITYTVDEVVQCSSCGGMGGDYDWSLNAYRNTCSSCGGSGSAIETVTKEKCYIVYTDGSRKDL